MVFSTPPISRTLRSKLDELDSLRSTLASRTGGGGGWIGGLRRLVRAGSIEGSTSIEGFSVPADEVVRLLASDRVAEPDDESRRAVACYARAMDHVAVLAVDPSFRWLDRVILDLHFDACQFQTEKLPGRWRERPIGVTGADGSLEFRGPEPRLVPGLMTEVVEWLAREEGEDVVVRAAMAHLQVISAHPFEDGNGRISRIVQSLVLAREGSVAPEFASIEEHLGHHTSDYYAALREAQGGGFNPDRDASAWVEFCVDAHLAQARGRLAQIEAAAARWERLEAVVELRGWPDRLVIALEQSAMGSTDRGRYAREAGISDAGASADLRRLVDAGLLDSAGRGRDTHYLPAPALLEALGESSPRP